MRARLPRLPEFIVEARLGGGPTCDVYSALDTTGQPGWAVKVIREEAASDPTNVQLLKQEARVGMAVRHPNLVRILRVGPEDHWPHYLVMERVPGQSLRRVLNRTRCLPSPLAITIAHQVASALGALHAAGFVHGDVKPDNLHLNPERNCTLLDLGFAHRSDEDDYSGTDFILGTANYVAPELCEQPGVDSPASDIFSLGVTVFELLTGQLPYPDGDVEQTMVLHRDHRPDSLNRWAGRWPDGLTDLVDQMLARDPDERPTAMGLARQLAELGRQNWQRKSAA